ncbi:uncharacterized protein LOC121360884 [Pyrgilauda ruficollis]|uniref:uncharacterized protein LOC121360884 n=1 Tax=Pyrgilauda ruficollis TaxID=221976 RepID=UPI001B8791CB|nr:uncharacterized protein LOC121360884 [Pyrgilauda ruficollis]
MSHRDSVVGPGQEKSSNSSHLCQKPRCLSSQSQEASAPGVCAGGLLVLPRLWVSQGWHKDSCRSWSGTGAAALWSHCKGTITEHFGGCLQNSICSWISLQVQQPGCPAGAPWPLPCLRHREPRPELLSLPVTKGWDWCGFRRIYCSHKHQLRGPETLKECWAYPCGRALSSRCRTLSGPDGCESCSSHGATGNNCQLIAEGMNE